ncbi:MAG: RNA methyltransferase [Balneolales bacterium]|nr:RNA methyltransferase [Balneolales bacterium]
MTDTKASTGSLPLSKALLKKYRSLHQKKFRSKYRLFIAEGDRTVRQFLHRTQPGIESLLISPEYEAEPQLLKLCGMKGISVFSCTAGEFAELSDTKQPQGILAVCKQADFGEFDEKQLQGGSVYLALDDLRDPGNLGTIYRTAAWFGISGLLLGKGCADLYNPKVTRSTAGATGSLPAWETDLSAMLEKLSTNGCQILLLDLSKDARTLQEVAAEQALQKKESRPPLVLVTGNEAHGISPELRGRYPAVYIPGMDGDVESLNAATSTAIALYALSRMR